MDQIISSYFNLDVLRQSLPYLQHGLILTFWLTLAIVPLAMLAGLVVAMLFDLRVRLLNYALIFYIDLFRAFPFGEPGYIWQDVDDAPTTVGFDCLRCPVAEFFARHEEAELCVQTWCNLDFPLAEQWGGRLERASTIAAGADRCDFRWRVGRGPEP